MQYQTYINLPVENLEKSKSFFNELGFTFNPQFSNEVGACMLLHEGNCYVMLLTKPFFQSFFPHKVISDTNTSVEVAIALQCATREAVDALVSKAISAGGRTYKEPQQIGVMYSHGFEDLDGHIWEVGYMQEQGD